MQPILYSSTDTDAPQLPFEKGSLNNILKACLVTGYGNKPAAGWEVVYDSKVDTPATDNYNMAFRSLNQSAIGVVLYSKDNNSYYTDIEAFNNWDADTKTGVDKWDEAKIRKQGDTRFTNLYWHILATDKFFYFIVSAADKENMAIVYGFGDVLSYRNDRQYAALLAWNDIAYGQEKTGHEVARLNNKTAASFPDSLHKTFSNSWGDRSKSDNNTSIHDNYKSDITIFSRFALYVTENNIKHPQIELPGSLMPFCEVRGYRIEPHCRYFDNQLHFKNPIFGVYQPWHGYWWWHMDDWG